MTIRHAGIAVIAVAALLAGAASAMPAAKTQHLRMVVVGQSNQEQTVGSGTFKALGGIADQGTWIAHKNPTTFVDNWRFVGRRGTFKLSDINNRWTITSGTKAYAGLTGKGTEKETNVGFSGFRVVLTGTVTR